MLYYLYKFCRELFLYYYYSKERKAIEDERKLDEYLRFLRRDQTKEEIKLPGKESQPLVEYKCLKKEGVITSLSESSGVINDVFTFTKVAAKSEWNQMRVGRRLSFLVFEGTVSNIQLYDDFWDGTPEVDVKIPENNNNPGFNTDIRTIVAGVKKIENDILIADMGNNREEFVPLDGNECDFEAGDVIKLECIIQEDDMSWDPSIGSYGNILNVISCKPNGKKRDIGRVSSVFRNYSVIDDTVIVLKSLVSEDVKLCDTFEFEAVESFREIDGRCYNWRVSKLIKKVSSGQNRSLNDNREVNMPDCNFNLRQSSRFVGKFVAIYNNSAEKLKLKSCEISSLSDLIQLDRSQQLSDVDVPSGRSTINLKIFPRISGSFVEEIIADFGSFQKKCLVKIEVTNTDPYAPSAREFNSENSELIPGQKVRIAPRFIDVRIDTYCVPPELRCFDFKKKIPLLLSDLVSYDPVFNESLTPENYLKKMRYCVYFEEIGMEIAFSKYVLERAHFTNKQEYLRLEVKGVAEKRPSLSIGDFVHVSDPFLSTKQKSKYEGIIHKVEQNAILLKFHSSFHSSHGNRDYRIEFFFSRGGFRKQQHALSVTVKPNGLGFDFLFPEKSKIVFKPPQVDVTKTEEIQWFNEKLNQFQKEAVMNILRGESRPLPYVIFGPPGSGKTQTVVECIEQISTKIPSSRIIVAAPSNSAANLIIERLIATGRFKGGDIIRFVSFNQIEKNLIPEHLKKFCATINIGFDDGKSTTMKIDDSGLRFDCSKSVVVQYKIYVSTLSSLGPLMQIKFPPDHFTHVIIDEAGQCVETETLIPTTLISKKKGQVILAGDPKQLGPILVSQVASFCNFDKSLLERFCENEIYQPVNGNFDSRFVTKLKKNYRSLPSILSTYNDMFYDKELEAIVNDVDSPEIQLLQSIEDVLWNRETADKKCGVYFVNVNAGRNMRTVESSSWYNEKEAAHVCVFIRKLRSKGIAGEDIGIITPYALQVKHFRRIFESALPDCGIKVGTVEEFQGQERKIILISTVRTNASYVNSDLYFSLGFLKSEKRMNVAISRARALLVIFGKESILGQDEKWNSLIQYTKQKGTYVSILK